MNLTNLSFLNVDEIKSGINKQENGNFNCIFCGEVFCFDEVYKIGERFFRAEKAAELHIETAHESAFKRFIAMESKTLGLTENQKRLIELIHSGLGDKEIAKKLDISYSTVRHQRFMFRERARQAKLFLALYEIAEDNRDSGSKLIEAHPGATMLDDRYMMTRADEEDIIKKAFTSFAPLKLSHFPVKEKKKIAILRRITAEFETGKKYKESEINAILESIYPDYVTIRRYLIEYGFLDRTVNCSEYWIKEVSYE